MVWLKDVRQPPIKIHRRRRHSGQSTPLVPVTAETRVQLPIRRDRHDVTDIVTDLMLQT